MSISKHIYYANSEYPRTIVLSHGSSETQVLSDSDDGIEEDPRKYERIWRSREGPNWKLVVRGIPKEEKWLSKALARAKKNGDL